jgi:Virulence factor membrane-bound polymerase, C-terminal/O-Antigen ligase/Protein glycosylation ligase
MKFLGWQRFSQTSSTQFWICCSIVTLAVSWLIPNHYPPFHEFFNDFWIACFFAGLYIWALLTKRVPDRINLPASAVLMFGLALVPLAQWSAGILHYSGQALLSSSYLLACALVVSLGYTLKPLQGRASIAALFAAILLASLANAVVIFIQKTGQLPVDDISFPGVLIFQMFGPRFTGNIGQANQMATLLVWGLLAAWWFWQTQQLRGSWFIAASAILTMALVCTQSRIAYLNLLVLAIVGILAHIKARHSDAAPDVKNKLSLLRTNFIVGVPALWLALVLVCYGLLYMIERWLGLDTELRTGLLADPVRSIIYPLFLEACLNNFWFGYGWTHLTRAQMDLPLDGIELGVYFLHAHNIFIDLLLWLGVPIGLGVISIIFLGMFSIFKKANTTESYIPMCLLIVLLGHSAVEFPHMYAYFLLPAAWVVGVLAAQLNTSTLVTTKSQFVLRIVYLHAVSLLMVLLLMAYVWDYKNIDREFMLVRLKSARIKVSDTVQIDKAIILNQFEDRLRMEYVQPIAGTSDTALDWMREAALGYPSLSTHYNLICQLAINGYADEAQTWMHRFNKIADKVTAAEFVKRWDKFRKEHSSVALPAWPISGVRLAKPSMQRSTPLVD